MATSDKRFAGVIPSRDNPTDKRRTFIDTLQAAIENGDSVDDSIPNASTALELHREFSRRTPLEALDDFTTKHEAAAVVGGLSAAIGGLAVTGTLLEVETHAAVQIGGINSAITVACGGLLTAYRAYRNSRS